MTPQADLDPDLNEILACWFSPTDPDIVEPLESCQGAPWGLEFLGQLAHS